jgi:hypothetical protein
MQQINADWADLDREVTAAWQPIVDGTDNVIKISFEAYQCCSFHSFLEAERKQMGQTTPQ